MSENAYKQAGVDVEAGYESVRLIKDDVKRTAIEGVLGGIGGFGGLFEISKDYKNPVLVSGTDGVGTKLKLAFLMDKHDTIGQDCVAMCVNDVACSGAKPIFFLDYLAVGKNVPEKIAQIYQNDKLLYEIDLTKVKEPYTITIDGDNGAENQVLVENGQISMQSASCPDHLCVKQGTISDGILPIICLPNHIRISVASEEESSYDVQVY